MIPEHNLPSTIADEGHLEDVLSEPTSTVLSAMQKLSGDVLVLGAGGKMGLSLTRMIHRASQQIGVSRSVVAASRFTRPSVQSALDAEGILTSSGDLLDEPFLNRLPDAENIVFMTGVKFGTRGKAGPTWAMNTYLPGRICRRFPDSRILAFSTGNVYPLVPIDSGGSRESDPPEPVGEYVMSALGRERIFELFSDQHAQPVTIVRLNYAVEMRYGVLVDLARCVWMESPVDLSMGYVNVIWQADANALALCAFADASSPPFVINIAGPERVDVRAICERFAVHFGKTARFVNRPADTALLSDGSNAHRRYGMPRVSLSTMIDWIADWVQRSQPLWDKPTGFQVRDGRF
jgi:nucleoside-diphosphate-sugar epimerase